MSVLTLAQINVLKSRLTTARANGLDNIIGANSLQDIYDTLDAADLSNLANLDAAVSTVGGDLEIETVTSSQTLTAPANAKWARVVMVGGGGSGMSGTGSGGSNGSGHGGMGGEILEFTTAVTGGGSYPVVIGGGGANASDEDGDDTTGFGLTAQGGESGKNTANHFDDFGAADFDPNSKPFFERYSRAFGGAGTDTNFGGSGTATQAGSSKGLGGSLHNYSVLGGGGSWGEGGNAAGGASPEANGGGGGAGGSATGGNSTGQDGAAGRIIVEWLS